MRPILTFVCERVFQDGLVNLSPFRDSFFFLAYTAHGGRGGSGMDGIAWFLAWLAVCFLACFLARLAYLSVMYLCLSSHLIAGTTYVQNYKLFFFFLLNFTSLHFIIHSQKRSYHVTISLLLASPSILSPNQNHFLYIGQNGHTRMGTPE